MRSGIRSDSTSDAVPPTYFVVDRPLAAVHVPLYRRISNRTISRMNESWDGIVTSFRYTVVTQSTEVRPGHLAARKNAYLNGELLQWLMSLTSPHQILQPVRILTATTDHTGVRGLGLSTRARCRASLGLHISNTSRFTAGSLTSTPLLCVSHHAVELLLKTIFLRLVSCYSRRVSTDSASMICIDLPAQASTISISIAICVRNVSSWSSG